MKSLFTFFLVVVSFFAFACECPPIEPASKKICEQYDVIFYGKVDSIIPCGTEGIGTAYFSIISLYKGSAEQHVSVDYDCTSSCMMSFAKGEEWIIYSVYQHFDLLTVSLCSHSRKKITDGSADFYEAASQRTFSAETLRNRPHSAAHRRLGRVRRKPGADCRAMAYSRPSALLSRDGNCLDYPIETIG